MKLTCFPIGNFSVSIQPAPGDREWMDETRQKFANRCLPLVAANTHGWEILGQDACRIRWNGGEGATDIEIVTDSGTDTYVASHFGHGIVTFRVHCILQTEPGFNTWISGPVNRFKDGIQAMTGLMETDWMPYAFTMNWQITRPDTWISFSANEPVCHIFPVARGLVDSVRPRMRSLSSEPELEANYRQWQQARQAFNKALADRDPAAEKQKWQKHYFRGQLPDGTRAIGDHQTKMKPRPFTPD
jgi:hypothetical protein